MLYAKYLKLVLDHIVAGLAVEKFPYFFQNFLNNTTGSYSCTVNKLNPNDDANHKEPTYLDKMTR